MKKIILFVALFVPLLVFVFLFQFGNNKFDIPVYYTTGIGRGIAGCNPTAWRDPRPYLLPDSALKAWGWTGEKVTLIVLNDKGIEKNLARIADQFEPGEYATVKLNDAPFEVKTCMLLAGDTSRVVMVDGRRQIRGYYTPTSNKEADRLKVEISILLKYY